jgi:glycosyltransferase 2 family protein
MSAVLGTVAVERIVDGLVISVLFFACYVAAEPGAYPPGLRFAAWLSLLGFVGLTLFLAFALRWPARTIRIALGLTLLSRLAPALAERIADKLRALIHGFRALHQPRDLVPFLLQTALYWGCNGLGMWLLARAMHLEISLAAAYAAMAFTGVLISLPNAPGLVGQFHYGVILALGAYLPREVVSSYGGAYAIALHGIQFVWYVGVGALALVLVGDGGRSLREVVIESKAAAEQTSEAQ